MIKNGAICTPDNAAFVYCFHCLKFAKLDFFQTPGRTLRTVSISQLRSTLHIRLQLSIYTRRILDTLEGFRRNFAVDPWIVHEEKQPTRR
jgi:hypothetical protein